MIRKSGSCKSKRGVMKTKRTGGARRGLGRRRSFMLEALEPRVVLDGGMGAEVAQVAAADAGFERFESAGELRQFLVDAAVHQWKDLFGTTIKHWPYPPYLNSVDPNFDTAVLRGAPGSAGGAVSASLAIQKELESTADATPQDRRMRFRIGIHLGDVIEKADGTIYGDGVNVAARLQALAEPAVCDLKAANSSADS